MVHLSRWLWGEVSVGLEIARRRLGMRKTRLHLADELELRAAAVEGVPVTVNLEVDIPFQEVGEETESALECKEDSREREEAFFLVGQEAARTPRSTTSCSMTSRASASV